MTNRAKKKFCPYCSVRVRRVGKHVNQKHLSDYVRELGYRDGFDDHRSPNPQYESNPEYLDAYDEGHRNS